MTHTQDIYLLHTNVIFRTGGYFAPPLDQPWRYDKNHAFCQNKFYFVTEGTFLITIDGKEYTARPGSWFFIPAGVLHRYHNLPGKKMAKYWMHFDIYPSNDLLLPRHIKHCVYAGNAPQILKLFQEFDALCPSNALPDRLRVKAIILQLLAEYLTLAGNQQMCIAGEDEEGLKNVLSYMHKNFKQNLHTEQLAAVCHLHPTHFIRIFKAKMGRTPQQYLTDIRMEYAKQLLDSSDAGIAEIAAETGFYDLAHFSRMFRRYFSMTPSEYRKTAPKR